jgi:hypothetical protein
MPDLNLLKYARARDSQEFVWRVAAAMTVQAQYNYEAKPADQTVESLKLTDWVLENPLQPLAMMTAFAATHPPIAAKVKYEQGTIDTADVLDEDIKYAVGTKWPLVAAKMFGTRA